MRKFWWDYFDLISYVAGGRNTLHEKKKKHLRPRLRHLPEPTDMEPILPVANCYPKK
jgi:hypothetical protein